jgi:hypothetical protein
VYVLGYGISAKFTQLIDYHAETTLINTGFQVASIPDYFPSLSGNREFSNEAAFHVSYCDFSSFKSWMLPWVVRPGKWMNFFNPQITVFLTVWHFFLPLYIALWWLGSLDR